MLLTFSLLPMLQAQSTRIKAKLADLDRTLASRYGDRYFQVKQQLDGTKVSYEQTRAEAERTGTIPLEQKQESASREVAKAGSSAARTEAMLKQRLKDFWLSVKNKNL
ncbi:hypothetical protein [Chamaesiphon sp. VAR_48_metabat_403]|uniref:hypothetical protein n=1 Tax=Chamaesiphon sp. VAR_48_metabat_403 TaxID=2964700 RepID=UPI00286DD946|nr:hypothetical protein [Chamaesiphon sp. VAR_48_metabat_403]